ncbi:uncharacterized protein [Rutidosis leptorrhynchoides]|uniref:uncharacterized protein n=1 Tax=Rutidosis leptorrhynchoides TaxID=125765 RepID=UPI003A999CF4
MFPRLFACESYKFASVSDRISNSECEPIGRWNWVSMVRGRTKDELDNLDLLIDNAHVLNNEGNSWKWKLSTNNVLTVTNLSYIIDQKLLGVAVSTGGIKWLSWVPEKVNVFMWRLNKNKLPTTSNLINRGVMTSNGECSFRGGDKGNKGSSLHFMSLCNSFMTRAYLLVEAK